VTYAENTTVSVEKSKAELVAMGVSSIERDMHRALAEQIEASYKTENMPPLLGMGGPS